MLVKKIAKQLIFILVFLSHLGFIVAMFLEKQNNTLVYTFLIVAIVLLIVAYASNPFKSKDDEVANIWNIAFVFIGAYTTYILHFMFGFSVVLAAALVGLIVSFIPEVTIGKYTFKHIPIAVYCGTFVGMTNVGLEPNYIFIGLASLLTGLILIGTKNAFHGLGGKLGTYAFGGVLLASFITYFLRIL